MHILVLRIVITLTYRVFPSSRSSLFCIPWPPRVNQSCRAVDPWLIKCGPHEKRSGPFTCAEVFRKSKVWARVYFFCGSLLLGNPCTVLLNECRTLLLACDWQWNGTCWTHALIDWLVDHHPSNARGITYVAPHKSVSRLIVHAVGRNILTRWIFNYMTGQQRVVCWRNFNFVGMLELSVGCRINLIHSKNPSHAVFFAFNHRIWTVFLCWWNIYALRER